MQDEMTPCWPEETLGHNEGGVEQGWVNVREAGTSSVCLLIFFFSKEVRDCKSAMGWMCVRVMHACVYTYIYLCADEYVCVHL